MLGIHSQRKSREPLKVEAIRRLTTTTHDERGAWIGYTPRDPSGKSKSRSEALAVINNEQPKRKDLTMSQRDQQRAAYAAERQQHLEAVLRGNEIARETANKEEGRTKYIRLRTIPPAYRNEDELILRMSNN